MIRTLSLALGFCLIGPAMQAQSGIRLTLEEAQAVAAERAYAVRYAGIDKDQAASTTRETIASGFPRSAAPSSTTATSTSRHRSPAATCLASRTT